MRFEKLLMNATAICLLFAGSRSFAAPITVGSVGLLDPNPNALTIVDAASNTSLGANGLPLAAFQTLMQGPAGAFQRNTGGVVDFQEAFQGGTWPSQTSA